MAETVPSWPLATHTRSAPNAMPLGPLPTGIVSTLEVAASIRSTALPLLLVTQTALSWMALSAAVATQAPSAQIPRRHFKPEPTG